MAASFVTGVRHLSGKIEHHLFFVIPPFLLISFSLLTSLLINGLLWCSGEFQCSITEMNADGGGVVLHYLLDSHGSK